MSFMHKSGFLIIKTNVCDIYVKLILNNVKEYKNKTKQISVNM